MPKPIAYRANAFIYFNGDKADGVSILKQGKVELTHQDLHTGEKIRESVQPGEFFGVRAALAGNLHDETAMAATNCTVVHFTVPEFEKLVSGNPRILMKMLQVFSNQLRRIHRQAQSRLSTEDLDISQEAGLFSVGEYYMDEGQYAQASYAYKRYLKHWPTGVYAPQAKLKVGEAETMWESSLNGKKENPSAYSTMTLEDINSQYNLRNYQAAMKGFLSLLQDGGGSEHRAYAEFRVGCCFYHLKRYPDAIKQLTSVLHRYPQHEYLGEAVCYIGLSYETMGEKERAVGLYRKACSILPEGHALYRQMIAKIRLLGGQA